MTDESLEDLEKKLIKLEKDKEDREKNKLIALKEKELLLKIEKLEAELKELGVEFDLKQKGAQLRDEKLKSDLKQELNDSSETPQIIAKNKSEKDAASFMLKILLRFVILLGFLIFLRVLNI